MNTQPIRKEEIKRKGEVIDVDFQTGKKKSSKKKSKGKDIKYRKDGKPKQTKSNAKKNRDNVYPFKEEDIPKMVQCFQKQIDIAIAKKSKQRELIARRNLAGFIMGMNIGLRASDLVSLKWSDIYDKDFRLNSSHQKEKTCIIKI